MLGLDEDASVSALAFGANVAAGLNEWPRSGGDEMFFHVGFAARNAVLAAQLARAGARARRHPSTGRRVCSARSTVRIGQAR